MSAAAPLAGLAAALGVWGAWEALAAVEAAAAGRALARALAPLRRPGADPTPPERRRLTLVGVGALAAAGWLLAGPLAAVALAAAGPLAVGQALELRRRRHRAALAAAAPAVARVLADALSGGHGLRSAIVRASRDGSVGGAAGHELRDAARRLALGADTDAVLERLRERADDPAWDTLAAAVMLQRDSGGDLAGLLRGVAVAREQARRAEADARALTAQARASARIVLLMGLGGPALGLLGSPGTAAAALAHPLGLTLAVAGGTLGVVGMLVIRRLARPEWG
jgi:tight adherence protein B